MYLEIGIGVIFCVILFFLGRKNKKNLDLKNQELKEYQEKVEKLLSQMNDKNVLMERASASLQDANRQIKLLSDNLITSNSDLQIIQKGLEFQKSQYEKLLSQKKSSEVRLGLIAENMAPFLNDYPFPPETGKFLGQPVDMIHFLEDKIVIVEIKSGGSQLSNKQRKIRDLIQEGKVEFFTYRIQ